MFVAVVVVQNNFQNHLTVHAEMFRQVAILFWPHPDCLKINICLMLMACKQNVKDSLFILLSSLNSDVKIKQFLSYINFKGIFKGKIWLFGDFTEDYFLVFYKQIYSFAKKYTCSHFFIVKYSKSIFPFTSLHESWHIHLCPL